MASMHVRYSGDDNDASIVAFYVADARITALRALSHVDISDAEAVETYDRLTEMALAWGANIFGVALMEHVEITTRVAGHFVRGALYDWESCAPVFPDIEANLRIVWTPQGDEESRILDVLLEAISSIADLATSASATPEMLSRAATGFRALAEVLDQCTYLDDALACAVSGMSFAGNVDLISADEHSRFAVGLARRSAADGMLTHLLSARAHLLAKIAADDPSRCVDAFDAFSVALGRLQGDANANMDVVRAFRAWTQDQKYLYILAPMVLALMPPEEQPQELRDLVARISGIVAPVYIGDISTWVEQFLSNRDYLIEVANARWNLLPRPLEDDARAVWNTWSLRHRQLLNAIPHNKSILQEENLKDLLLELGHELTHVFCMVGFVGLALTAMRWALVEFEIHQWSGILNRSGQAPTPDFVDRIGVAPLREADIVSLATAEQSVEVERKIQLLENTWAPWFEGLALFGELAADPQLDPKWESPVASVIYNLWDRNLAMEARDAGLSIKEIFARDRARAESLYADAMYSHGKDRLRTYLMRHHKKYLAGYVAVRSVVAAWRSTLGEPLRGDEAFQILLHMTRVGSFDPIPDLGLPLDAFSEAVMTKHLEWVRAVASATANDLKRAIWKEQPEGDTRRPFRWVSGRLEEAKDGTDVNDDLQQTIERLAHQALSSLTGERADAGRVEGADDVLRACLAATAHVLEERAKKEPLLFHGQLVARATMQYSILPLAQVDCPFWLVQESRSVACLIRTRQKDRELGTPSYDGLVFSLDEAEYGALEVRVMQGGSRLMTVIRVVDLVTSGGRLNGLNLLVFQYEDWIHIQPRGHRMGTTVVDESLRQAIKARLTPTSVSAFQEKLTGEDHPVARRTDDWIQANSWHIQLNELSVDVTLLAEHVRDMANQVLSNSPEDIQVVSRELLEFVIGDRERAAQIFEHGFAPLADHDPSSIRRLIRFLDASARSPVDGEPEVDGLSESVASVIAPLLERTPYGWDVICPYVDKRGIQE